MICLLLSFHFFVLFEYNLNVVKYTRQFSTEYLPELRQVPGPIESTEKRTRLIFRHLDQTSLVNIGIIIWDKIDFSCGTQHIDPE